MTKIILIVVLGTIALILIAALSGKNPLAVLKNITGKFIEKCDNDTDAGDQRKNADGTVLFPVLYLNQKGKNKKDIYKHEIYKRDFFDTEGKMVGVPISRPDATFRGIKLHGEVTRNGRYNKKDPDTLNAFTVNEHAIIIGIDDDVFYGQVTNHDATVYVVDKDNIKRKLSYKEQFAISDGTYLLINHQLLSFSFPSVPEFPFGRIDDTANDDGSELIKDIKKDLADIVIDARKLGNRIKNKDAEKGIEKNEDTAAEHKASRGFPLNEDDF